MSDNEENIAGDSVNLNSHEDTQPVDQDGEYESNQDQIPSDDLHTGSDSRIDKIFQGKRKAAEMLDELASRETNTGRTRRGRKKNQPRRYVDPSIKLNTIQLNRESEENPDSLDIGPTPRVDLACSACDEVFYDKAKINYHILASHNGLARINNKEPFTAAEENEALRTCLRRLKKLQCPKPGCQKTVSTLAGYKTHLQTCGSAEKVRCTVCNAELKPSSLPVHMKNSHSSKVKPILKTEENGVRQARKAAVKARKSVQMFSSGLGSLCSIIKNSDDEKAATETLAKGELPEESMCELLISRDVDLVTVSTSLAEQWKQCIEEQGLVHCPSDECEKKFTTIPGIRYHYQRCGKDMNFKCIECGFKALKKITVKKHVLKHIRGEEMPENVDEESQTTNTVAAKSTHSRAPSVPRSGQFNCYLHTFLDTFVIAHKTMKHVLFDAWFPVPHLWQRLNPSEHKDYLPLAEESAKFKCRRMRLKKRRDKTTAVSEEEVWSSLPLFNSIGKLGEHTSTMFVGGTVRALAWCPTPTGMSLENEHEQYLAVSADRDFQDIRQATVNQPLIGPGIIQIWNMSVLSKYGLNTLPKLSFCIAHNFGQVKCMEWCNGGCFTIDDNYEGMERIGLLAAGCSDGNIYIYSVPRPESLSYNAEDTVIIAKPSPVVHLKHPSCNVVAVMSMSWFSAGNRNKIIAGFGNGLVCIWDLTTKSQLLWQDVSNEFSTLIPYICFMAHNGPVSGVAFCPNTGSEHFCTGSVDKEMKIWSDTNLEHPITSVRKTMVTNCHWSPLACGVFTTYDDSFLFRQNRTYYFEVGYHGHPPRCLAFHNGCCTGMSFSEWLNTIATCDYGGEVVATLCYQYQEFFKKKKNHRLYKLTPVCRAIIEKVDSGESDVADGLFAPPKTYADMTANHGLVFLDSPIYDFSQLAEDELNRVNMAEGMTHQPFSAYNLQSVNAVSWNPNCGAQFWLATGFNAGFVRLHCITGFDNHKLNTYDTHKLEQVISEHGSYDPSDTTELNNTTVENSVNNNSINEGETYPVVKIAPQDSSNILDEGNTHSDTTDNVNDVPSVSEVNGKGLSPASSPSLGTESSSPDLASEPVSPDVQILS